MSIEALRQFQVLLRVKTLREERALAALQHARSALRAGEADLEAAKNAVEKSAVTLKERIHQVYLDVIGQTVDMPGIDRLKHRATQIEFQHQQIEDRRARAAHRLIELGDAVESAQGVYREAQTDREKYDGLVSDMKMNAAAETTMKEDVEVEDLFARPRRAAFQ